MLEYQTEEYQDRDGNRGQIVWNYELEASDSPVIRELIIGKLKEDEYNYNDEITIHMMAHYTEEDIAFDVEISDYISNAYFDILQKEHE